MSPITSLGFSFLHYRIPVTLSPDQRDAVMMKRDMSLNYSQCLARSQAVDIPCLTLPVVDSQTRDGQHLAFLSPQIAPPSALADVTLICPYYGRQNYTLKDVHILSSETCECVMCNG